jgi:hypothetical protein
MTSNPRISNLAALDALDAVLDLLNVGGAGYIEIRTGAAPGSVSDAATGTLLATCVLSNPAFPAASDAMPGATASADAITDDASADANGVASYFRAYDNGGTGVIQGVVNVSNADMIVPNTNVTMGAAFAITAWAITLPEGS